MNEEKTKKRNKKPYMILGIIFLSIALISAALVMYYDQKQINMSVESPLILNGELVENVELMAGDGYRLYLVEGENLLDRGVETSVQFTLLNVSSGLEIVDTTGFYLAFSEDIQYAYDPIYGNAANWAEAQVWMFDNLDWFDWYLTGIWASEYNASVITNHGGNSAYDSAISFNTPIPQEIAPGKFYAVVYMDVDAGVIPGDYTLSVDIMPTV